VGSAEENRALVEALTAALAESAVRPAGRS
jgi:hypothetical protein